MKKLLFFLSVLMCSCSEDKFPLPETPQREVNTSLMPEFSWETLPVCLHLYKDIEFSVSDVEFISRFPIICIEKAHNKGNAKGLEYNTSKAASILLNANPKQKILFYWNSVVDYGDMYAGGRLLVGNVKQNTDDMVLRQSGIHPDWALKDKNGKYVNSGQGNRCHFDITIPEVKDWWLSVPKNVISENGVNGVFIDKVRQYTQQINVSKFGQDKSELLKSVYQDVMLKLREQSPANTLLITNSLRGSSVQQPDWGLMHLEYSDGGMIEHFADLSGKDKDIIANDIKLIQECAEKGKVVIVKGWPRFNFTDMGEYKNNPQAELEEMAKQDIVFPLAAFLVAAGKYAYFCYSWGYEYSEGGMVDYPEYSNKLGEPLGLAEKNGYVYTREFEHASVWVDIEKREGKITWK